MVAVIFTGGSLDRDFAAGFLDKIKYDILIAADKGTESAKALGLKADFVLGDFDSANMELVKNYVKEYNPKMEVFPPEKDYTDTEIAIRCAEKNGADTVYILGASGTRLDHTIGNIHALRYLLEKNIKAYTVNECNRIHLLGGVSVGKYSETLKKDEQWGKYISFIPLTSEVENVSLKGFKYPLDGGRFEAGGGGILVGISNEIEDKEAKVSFSKGILIAVESRDL
ncbi:MAG: thiamine diphosphokinase [Eubacterium sp.]|nr:thiamine diphosphokinase [Eubacterium sp.]